MTANSVFHMPEKSRNRTCAEVSQTASERVLKGWFETLPGEPASSIIDKNSVVHYLSYDSGVAGMNAEAIEA